MIKQNKIIITIAITFIILMILFLFYYFQKQRHLEPVKKLNATQIAMKIDANPIFNWKTRKGIINIENKNINIYNMIVEIYLDDNHELIYKSKKLKPGEKLDKITLTKKLEVGTHHAIAYFNAYDHLGRYRGKSGAQIKINIIN